MITRRPRRLDGVSYIGFQRYFLTTCTAFKRPTFATEPHVAPVLTQLLHAAVLFEFAIPAYCFMPDHIHVLLIAQSERADFKAFVKRFKQLSGFTYRERKNKPLWQPGYHERVLRDDEATLAIARYILENPIRAGLATARGSTRSPVRPSMK